MLLLTDLVERLRSAARKPKAQDVVSALLRDVVKQPGIWEACQGLEGVDSRGVARISVDDHLTLVHVNLAPGFASRVHDHGVWAAIGVYEGQEDNVLYRRQGSRVVRQRRVSVVGPDVFCMAAADIHHIENRQDGPLRALHCYGGDLAVAARASYDLTTGRVTLEGGASR